MTYKVFQFVSPEVQGKPSPGDGEFRLARYLRANRIVNGIPFMRLVELTGISEENLEGLEAATIPVSEFQYGWLPKLAEHLHRPLEELFLMLGTSPLALVDAGDKEVSKLLSELRATRDLPDETTLAYLMTTYADRSLINALMNRYLQKSSTEEPQPITAKVVRVEEDGDIWLVHTKDEDGPKEN